jgi:hypothetical protein
MNMESLRLKCLLLGPFLLVGGGWITWMMLPSADHPTWDLGWQVYVVGPACILGGVALFCVGFRSKPPSKVETKEAAKDVAVDVVVKVLEQIAK